MAIIDILQHYDAKKKAAHAAKTVKHGVGESQRSQSMCEFLALTRPSNRLRPPTPWQAGAEISTVNPEQYSKRFYDFITTILS